MSKKKAAVTYRVPRGTLQRHIKAAERGLGVEKKLGRRCILTEAQEEDLVARLLDMESRLYGLTTEDVRHVVFSFCELNRIKHAFSQEKQMAVPHRLNSSYRRLKPKRKRKRLTCKIRKEKQKKIRLINARRDSKQLRRHVDLQRKETKVKLMMTARMTTNR
jgi:hypothetical protein